MSVITPAPRPQCLWYSPCPSCVGSLLGGAFCQLVGSSTEISAPTAHQSGLGGAVCSESSKERCAPARGCSSWCGKAGGAPGMDTRAAGAHPAGTCKGTNAKLWGPVQHCMLGHCPRRIAGCQRMVLLQTIAFCFLLYNSLLGHGSVTSRGGGGLRG